MKENVNGVVYALCFRDAMIDTAGVDIKAARDQKARMTGHVLSRRLIPYGTMEIKKWKMEIYDTT